MKAPIASFMLAVMAAVGSAQASVSIVFDYSLDSNGFFTSERRVIAQAAATSLTARMAGTGWARVDAAAAGGSYELAIINPSTLEVSWVPNVVIPENQITVRMGAMDWSQVPIQKFRESRGDSVTQLLSIRKVSGPIAGVLTSTSKYRPVDASISFDLQGIQGLKSGITRQWYFGSANNLNQDDRNQADPLYNNYTDFYTSLIHELGHILGIYDPAAFSSILEADPNFNIAWTSRIQADGRGGFVFTGARASQFYYNHVGQPIPLDTETRSHWAVEVNSQSADKWPSVSYAPNTPFRHGFSEMEFAALEDMGYTISSSVPVGQTLSFVSGWNLVGNGSNGTLDVASAFGDSNRVVTAWKWLAPAGKWAFYAPSLAGQALTDYAAGKGYEVLTTINAGEGFWINAGTAFTAQMPSGTPITSASFRSNLWPGWNLIATGDSPKAGEFNQALNVAPSATGEIVNNFVTLWAWSASQSNWCFYAPSLDAAGGTVLEDYIRSKGYLLDFVQRKTPATVPGGPVPTLAPPPMPLSPSMGFWVNKP